MRALFVCLLFLIGCAKPVVHLNNRYLDEQQTAEIISQMKKNGVEVKLNKHPFPKNIKQNTLIYSLQLKDPKVIEQIRHSLNNNGWQLQHIQSIVESNQWFTQKNLGLFLIPEGLDLDSGRLQADLALTYQSIKCENVLKLTLAPNNQFHFESNTPAYATLSGNWRLVSDSFIQLYLDDPHLNYYFQIDKTRNNDIIGMADIITLTPLSSSILLPSCVYEYGIRL